MFSPETGDEGGCVWAAGGVGLGAVEGVGDAVCPPAQLAATAAMVRSPSSEAPTSLALRILAQNNVRLPAIWTLAVGSVCLDGAKDGVAEAVPVEVADGHGETEAVARMFAQKR